MKGEYVMKEWQTRNLILRPSSQERDGGAFYQMENC